MLTRPEGLDVLSRPVPTGAPGTIAESNRRGSGAPTLGGAAWLFGAAATCLGSLLPWATVSGPGGAATTTGTSTDGMLTLVLGAVAAVLAARHAALAPSRFRPLAALGIGGLVLVVATADLVELHRFAVEEAPALGVAARAGVGLWITTLGAGITGFGAARCLREVRMARVD